MILEGFDPAELERRHAEYLEAARRLRESLAAMPPLPDLEPIRRLARIERTAR